MNTITLPGLHDRRVHVESDLMGGISAVAGLMAAARGSAPRFGELPDPTALVRTGCGQLRAWVSTSRLPEQITCLTDTEMASRTRRAQWPAISARSCSR
jgi:hypothetical protein